MEKLDLLRRDLEELKNIVKTITETHTTAYVSQKVFETQILSLTKDHVDLLKRFDKFVEDNKNVGFMLETYMQNVHDMQKCLRELTNSVHELKIINELTNKIINHTTPIEQHLSRYKVIYVIGSMVVAIVAIFSPESIPAIIHMIL